MKHLKGFRKLNRTSAHRKALFSNMVIALFTRGRIRTTVAKAKELRREAETLITRAKVKNLHNIRLIARVIRDKRILMKLFNDIAPKYVERPGGYTRVIKLDRRKGDGAYMAYIELIDDQVVKKKKKKAKVKKSTTTPNEKVVEKTELEKGSGIEVKKQEVIEAKEKTSESSNEEVVITKEKVSKDTKEKTTEVKDSSEATKEPEIKEDAKDEK